MWIWKRDGGTFSSRVTELLEERMELKRKVGMGRMKMAILLGDKEAVSATMRYILDTKGGYKSKQDSLHFTLLFIL